MAAAIAERLSAAQQDKTGQIVLLVDGAIVQVQMGEAAQLVTTTLQVALNALLESRA